MQELQNEKNEISNRNEKFKGELQALFLDYTSKEQAIDDLLLCQKKVEEETNNLINIEKELEFVAINIQVLQQEITALREEKLILEGETYLKKLEIVNYESELEHLDIIGSSVKDQKAAIEHIIKERKCELDGILDLGSQAEKLLLQVKTFKILNEVKGLDLDLSQLETQCKGLENRYEDINDYSTKFQKLLRSANIIKADEDKQRLQGYEEIIQLLYKRISPHPFFGPLNLDINSTEECMNIRFRPMEGQLVTAAVNKYFSMAQANAVALSIFLGTALLQTWSKLGFICIDDPVQHMDDLNTFSFLDLIQVIQESGRQIIVTTASEDLYRTMLSRFALLNTEEEVIFQAFRLIGVTPQGPEIRDDTPILKTINTKEHKSA
jgi:hypothetical protein